MTHKLDATNQSVGRLASRIAVILRGKIRANYQPNQLPQEKVVVSNLKLLRFTGHKFQQKIYHHYSGYPGGLKSITLDKLFAKNPEKVLRLAVYRMLATNRLRDKIIKNLVIENAN